MSQIYVPSSGGGGGGDNFLFTTFNSSGTWNMNSKTKYIEVYGFGSGASGASGRKGASASAGGGGGAGNGGSFYYNAPASYFNSSVSITIGASTMGAASQTVDNTDGNNGSAGNKTSFGSYMFSITPSSTEGGTTGTTSAAPSPNSYSIFGFIAGISAGKGSTSDGTLPDDTVLGINGAPGGGGGGYNSIVETVGGDGGSIQCINFLTNIVVGGFGGSESGDIDGENGNPPNMLSGFVTGGSGGGGGGGVHLGSVSGNGGNGGFPSGGGGGGGGGANGIAASGSGGNGAAGQILVIEYF